MKMTSRIKMKTWGTSLTPESEESISRCYYGKGGSRISDDSGNKITTEGGDIIRLSLSDNHIDIMLSFNDTDLAVAIGTSPFVNIPLLLKDLEVLATMSDNLYNYLEPDNVERVDGLNRDQRRMVTENGDALELYVPDDQKGAVLAFTKTHLSDSFDKREPTQITLTVKDLDVMASMFGDLWDWIEVNNEEGWDH